MKLANTLSGLTLGALLACAGLQAEETALSSEQLDYLAQAEAGFDKLLQNALGAAEIEVDNTQPLSYQELGSLLRENSIALRQSQLGKQIAAAELQQAGSVFDPTFKLSLEYQVSKTFERTEKVRRYRSETTVNDNGENVLIIDGVQDPRVPEVHYTNPRDEGFIDSTVVASRESITGDDKKTTMGAGVAQVLPWGGSFTIDYSAINQDTFFINNPQLLSADTEVEPGLVGFGSYKRPWVSALTATLTTPVPGGKGFGDLSDARVAQRTAILQESASQASLRAAGSDVLLNAELAYWDLVEAALGVMTASESLDKADAFLQSTRRLYNSRSANNYDLAQSELLLSRSRSQLRLRWSDYVAASDELSRQLVLPVGKLLSPTGFSLQLAELEVTTDDTADDTLSEQHPAYRQASIQKQIADLNSQAAQQQSNPDVAVDLSLSLRQSNRVFGYKSLGDSMGSVFEPDIQTVAIGAAYVYPVGNQAARAGSRISAAEKNRADFTAEASINSLQGDLRSARAGLSGAQLNIGFFAKASDLALQNYQLALRNQSSRRVKEYELTGLHTDFINARLDYIKALLDIKRADIRLLHAQGVLDARLGSALRNNPSQTLNLASKGGQ